MTVDYIVEYFIYMQDSIFTYVILISIQCLLKADCDIKSTLYKESSDKLYIHVFLTIIP